MDYIDRLKQFAARVAQISPAITNEEATKTALILPFFQMLGYDVFNPIEFVPEYTADVGVKKGEKVDYAIVVNEKPIILIEAKCCKEPLVSHDSQLFRYYGTTSAKIAILTNGILYRFYTDLDVPNKMDLVPFMEFNILDIKENLIPELKRFNRDNIDVDNISSAASDLRYMTAVKQLIANQMVEPDDNFLAYVIKSVYSGNKSAKIIEKFRDIVKRAFAQYINDVMNEKFKSVLDPQPNKEPLDETKDANESEDSIETEPSNGIITTAEELEAYIVIKAMLHGLIDASRIGNKDTKSYFTIILDGKVSKWICRLHFDRKKKFIIIPNAEGTDIRYNITSGDDLFQYRNELQVRLDAIR